jgi:sulfate transport system ATP-binding protein
VQNGKALLGPLAVDYPEHPYGESRPAAGYSRPHELALSRTPDSRLGLWAVLRDVNAAGPVVRLELVDTEARPVQVHLARNQFEALRPTVGERLYVTPRRVRVFLGAGDQLAGSGI